MKHTDQSDHPVSPHSIYKVVTSFAALFGLIKSGVSPSEFDPKAWYDRAIRVVGGLIILAMLIAGIVLTLADHFKR
ncbi:MAG TPA: hypothetical protein VFI38_18965 [Candidatus Acidoferrum sp.]|nr:hypothetical protein [Candidatus Acidoferrum sp.]